MTIEQQNAGWVSEVRKKRVEKKRHVNGKIIKN